jgi:hypothetical protein
LFVGNAPIRTLRRQHAQFGFREVQPASMFGRVVPLEPLDEPPGFGCRKGFIK